MDSDSLIQLKSLIHDGYYVSKSVPFCDFPLTKKRKYALLLTKSDGLEPIWFEFDHEDTKKYVGEQFKRQLESPEGYLPIYLCAITGFVKNNPEVVISFGNQVRQELLELGFSLDEKESDKKIFTLKGTPNSNLEDAEIQKDKLKNYLFNLSIHNKIGIKVISFSFSKKLHNSPYSIGPALEVEVLSQLRDSAYDRENKLTSAMYEYFSQAELRSKLIIGYSILEEFYAKPNRQRLLQHEEIEKINLSIDKVELSKRDRERLVEALSWQRKESDTTLIADSIGCEKADIIFIRKVRGKAAHLPKNSTQLKEALDKLDLIFEAL